MNVRQFYVTLGYGQRDVKIEAVKSYRRLFGVGLVDAKHAIDSMLPHGKSMLLNDYQVEQLEIEGFKVFSKKTKTIQVYISPEVMDNRKIEAIKRFRNASGFGLKEAKDVIDEMWFSNAPVDVGLANEYVVEQLRSAGFTVTGWIDNHFQSDLFEI